MAFYNALNHNTELILGEPKIDLKGLALVRNIYWTYIQTVDGQTNEYSYYIGLPFH